MFAAVLTGYILMAIRWEERDLADIHPEYAAYRQQVPMLIPRWSTSTVAARDSVPQPATAPAGLGASRVPRDHPPRGRQTSGWGVAFPNIPMPGGI